MARAEREGEVEEMKQEVDVEVNKLGLYVWGWCVRTIQCVHLNKARV